MVITMQALFALSFILAVALIIVVTVILVVLSELSLRKGSRE